MLDLTLLTLFIPTFFIVSITPGMCMTLAMTLGMTVGVRKTLYMMWGELLGVATVAIAAVAGIATIMMTYPTLFIVLKILGGLYLLWIGVNMWRSKGKMALSDTPVTPREISRWQLFSQGLTTAIANPKGWAFMVSLLPPFISAEKPVIPQMAVLIAIIMCSEFICMMLYASGGKTIGAMLTKQHNVKTMNRVSGALMVGVAGWLVAS